MTATATTPWDTSFVTHSSRRFVRARKRFGDILISVDDEAALRPEELWRRAFEIDPSRGEMVQGNGGPRIGREALDRISVGSTSALLRRFRRGGWVGKFQQKLFLSSTPYAPFLTRPYRELAILNFLLSQKINVPRPIGAAVKFRLGGYAYEGVIVTAELPAVTNLLELVYREKEGERSERLPAIVESAGRAARSLVAAGVLHHDLHLGNILVQDGGAIYLVDFDKAIFLDDRSKHARALDRLFKRFSRSARKHGVELLIPYYRAGLFDSVAG